MLRKEVVSNMCTDVKVRIAKIDGFTMLYL